MNLPDDFVSYLRSDAPRHGDLSDFPLYFEIWPEAEMGQWNRDYQVEKYAPGFYGFAGDGGGEMYAFGPDGAIYALPLVGMEAKVAKRLAGSWTEFESKIVNMKGAWSYDDVVNGFVTNRNEPPTRWLGPAHAEQPTFIQKPGTRSSFLISHKV